MEINRLECSSLSKDDELKELDVLTEKLKFLEKINEKLKSSNLELTKINNSLNIQLTSLKVNLESTIDVNHLILNIRELNMMS